MDNTIELQAIVRRYERRQISAGANRYSPLEPFELMAEQEKDRAIVRLITSFGLSQNIVGRSLLELGCGTGGNLLRFLKLGFRPENIVGNELLQFRLDAAREILPNAIRLVPGDATQLDFADHSFDVVCLFTVFSSILDDALHERLATKAWALTKPGGGILWYDFIYNNPNNRDVRGVPLRRVRNLFPDAVIRVRRVTLLPPIGRLVTRLYPNLYHVANSIPMLRSHVMCWIAKPSR